MCGSEVSEAGKICDRCKKIINKAAGKSKKASGLADALYPGDMLADDYEIVRLVGNGGAGKVYEAKQKSLNDMTVALKVLHKDLNNDPKALALLKKEVIIARGLAHDSIIKVYNIEKTGDRHFIVMEYVHGESLLSILKRSKKLSIEEFTPILLSVCSALEYSHEHDIIHLDIKPGNVLVGTSGKVKLCDFGIARMALGNKTTATQRLVMGSVGFMSPEQYSGRKSVSVKSDIYALGATTYFALFGETPVGVSDKEDLLPCVKKAMQSNPDERFDSVKDFRRAFVMESGFGAYPAPPTIMAQSPDPVEKPGPETRESPGAETIATVDIITSGQELDQFHDTATINVEESPAPAENEAAARPKEESAHWDSSGGPNEPPYTAGPRETQSKTETTYGEMTETSSPSYAGVVIGVIVIGAILAGLIFLVFR
jgi:serine/threonine-protein kinase